jgi:hypothetical protein
MPLAHADRTSSQRTMSFSRLSLIWPDIDSALGSATTERRGKAAMVAAKWAIQQSGLSHPLLTDGDVEPSTDLTDIVAELDDRYFELQEMFEDGRCPQSEVLAAFSRACAADSLDSAIRGETADAIYEAAMSSDDNTELRTIVLSALRGKE